MLYANAEDRQAPPEIDSNIWTDLWKYPSISTDYKDDRLLHLRASVKYLL